MASILADAILCLETADKLNSDSLRNAILAAVREKLTEVVDSLPKPKRYVLKPKETRSDHTPWTIKSEINAFRSEMLSFLRGAVPDRNHKANLAEVAKLWSMYKEAGTLKEVIACAKEAVISASSPLESMSDEESVASKS
jgi:hypothetical protein